jgi:hypothetical protein
MCLIIINKLTNNNIIMDDSISILLATTILALGGLGLYMYKSPDDTSSSKDNNTSSKEDHDEDNLFGSNLFNWGLSDENENENVNDDKVEEHDEDIKPRKRAAKTHKNRKMTGSSRRRY